MREPTELEGLRLGLSGFRVKSLRQFTYIHTNPKGPCTQTDILWPETSPYLGTLGQSIY